jgi:hypothetical protein
MLRARDWSDDFTFIIGDHRSRCPSSIAQFLSPRVAKFHSIDATIKELRLETEGRDGLFHIVLKIAKGGRMAIDSVRRRTFAPICTTRWNSELYDFIYGPLAAKSRRRMLLIIFDSCERLDAIFQQNWNSLRV